QRARRADVRGIEQLLTEVRMRDAQLGGKRPDAVSSLVDAVQAQLDGARRLQLARDHWALRERDYRTYSTAIPPLTALWAQPDPASDSTKALWARPPATLSLLQQTVTSILGDIAKVSPPDEFRSAHALLVSAAQLAGNAERIRREAVLAGDFARAWDA